MRCRAASASFVCLAIPEAYGGAGVDDFRYNAVLDEQAASRGFTSVAMALSVHQDVALPYLLDLTDDEQKERWLPVSPPARSSRRSP